MSPNFSPYYFVLTLYAEPRQNVRICLENRFADIRTHNERAIFNLALVGFYQKRKATKAQENRPRLIVRKNDYVFYFTMQYFTKIVYFDAADPIVFFHSVEGVAAYWSYEEVPIEPNFLFCFLLALIS